MIYRASKNQLCHLLTNDRQADSFYVVCIISIVFVGDFHNKTHNFMIIGRAPTSQYAIFSNSFFGLHLKFYSQISNYTATYCTFRKAASWENQQSAKAKTKAQISFAVTAKLISAFVFATRIVQFLLYLTPKFQANSSFL